MQPHTASRTAIATALARAHHTRLAPKRIIDDPWGERLLPHPARGLVYQIARIRNPALPQDPDEVAQQEAIDAWLRATPAYTNVIVRSRYTEDALHRAVAAGTQQYVLVGAGFDSYALRRPPEAGPRTLIEIDHPASQAFKRRCIADAGLAEPAALHFIAADLAAHDLASVLRASPMRTGEPAFFSWLGVTLYLTRDANLATLRAIASTAAPGSELVFTYVDQAVFEARAVLTEQASHAVQGLSTEVAAVGEPFVSGFDPANLEADLRRLGMRLLEDCSDADLLRRYDPEGLDGLSGNEVSRIAHARIEGPPAT
jgi:methyltransferase (TIGR00027 family)